jgi:hypothetical protein
MTAHETTVMEHTVYDAVCTTCPWVRSGFEDRDWAEMVAKGHRKEHAA